jgi:hypothetical protein
MVGETLVPDVVEEDLATHLLGVRTRADLGRVEGDAPLRESGRLKAARHLGELRTFLDGRRIDDPIAAASQPGDGNEE